MFAIVLAAGEGSRLGELTSDKPKAMLEVGHKAAIDWSIEALNVPEIRTVLVVHSGRWANAFRRWKEALVDHGRGARLPYLKLLSDGTFGSDERLGAVGDLEYAIARARVGRESGFLLLCADTICTWPVRTFLAAIERHPGAWLALRPARMVPDASSLGRVELDEHGQVTSFLEKRGGAAGGNVWLGPAWFPPGTAGLIGEYTAEKRGLKELPDSLGSFVSWLTRFVPVHGLVVEDGEAFDVGTRLGYDGARLRLGK